MRRKVSSKIIDYLEAPGPKRMDVWDTVLQCFGVRVSPGGRKTWFVIVRVGGRQKRVSIGTYPAITLAEARAEARTIIRDAQLGVFDDEQETPCPTLGGTVPISALSKGDRSPYAEAFAGTRTAGLSAQQISDFFCEHSASVRPIEHYAFKPSRKDLFVESVYALAPEAQYCALHDLASRERESKYPYPPLASRGQLLARLRSSICIEPIGLAFSRVSSAEFRKDWMTAHSRLSSNPAAAVTAARTMLETIFKTIVEERGGTPDTSGELARLLRQPQEAIGFSRGANQAEHQIVTGLASVIGNVSAISNAAGDRHGTAQASVFGTDTSPCSA